MFTALASLSAALGVTLALLPLPQGPLLLHVFSTDIKTEQSLLPSFSVRVCMYVRVYVCVWYACVYVSS